MQTLTVTLLLLCCHKSLGTLVVSLNEPSNEDRNTFLALNQGVEINNPLTFCLRFNIKSALETNYIFSSTDDKLVLILRFSINLGIVLINRVSFVFEIPKDKDVLPFHWYHIRSVSHMCQHKRRFFHHCTGWATMVPCQSHTRVIFEDVSKKIGLGIH